ncbi:hypothetical protein IE982_12450 [Enterobacter hormaechei]|nr:hypothetical protein [Enterobacter hormaechei]
MDLVSVTRGPGGYGAIMRYRQHEKTFSEGYFLTTNNRMELMAAIVALEALKRTLRRGAEYRQPVCPPRALPNGSTTGKNAAGKRQRKKPVKNVDLWKRLDAALGQHEIKWEWVKGHAGHPENERCDELARAAASNQPMRMQVINLNPDHGFLYCRVAPTVWRIRVFDLLCFIGFSVRGDRPLTRDNKLHAAQRG